MRITKTSVILIPLSHEVKLGALVFVSDVIVDTATFFPWSFDRQHFTQLTSAWESPTIGWLSTAINWSPFFSRPSWQEAKHTLKNVLTTTPYSKRHKNFWARNERARRKPLMNMTSLNRPWFTKHSTEGLYTEEIGHLLGRSSVSNVLDINPCLASTESWAFHNSKSKTSWALPRKRRENNTSSKCFIMRINSCTRPFHPNQPISRMKFVSDIP